MAEDINIRREQLRDILSRAAVEVKASLDRLDHMGPYELAEVRGAAGSLVAFFDKNGSCATTAELGNFDPVAFFDKNGSCGQAELRKFDPAAFFDKNGSCSTPPGIAIRMSKKAS